MWFISIDWLARMIAVAVITAVLVPLYCCSLIYQQLPPSKDDAAAGHIGGFVRRAPGDTREPCYERWRDSEGAVWCRNEPSRRYRTDWMPAWLVKPIDRLGD